jgi:hypothetical protein
VPRSSIGNGLMRFIYREIVRTKAGMERARSASRSPSSPNSKGPPDMWQSLDARHAAKGLGVRGLDRLAENGNVRLKQEEPNEEDLIDVR